MRTRRFAPVFEAFELRLAPSSVAVAPLTSSAQMGSTSASDPGMDFSGNTDVTDIPFYSDPSDGSSDEGPVPNFYEA